MYQPVEVQELITLHSLVLGLRVPSLHVVLILSAPSYYCLSKTHSESNSILDLSLNLLRIYLHFRTTAPSKLVNCLLLARSKLSKANYYWCLSKGYQLVVVKNQLLLLVKSHILWSDKDVASCWRFIEEFSFYKCKTSRKLWAHHICCNLRWVQKNNLVY